MTDFPDTPFTITQPQGGDGLRHADRRGARHPARAGRRFYRDFLNTPQALNHFQTMNRYWMEDSFGKYGVQLDAFGPYQLPGRQYQYFLTDQAGGNDPRTARR